jgi:2-amino-4-hydroxy-6-hydroxymethyldihydropteridine diphosphokinase
MKSSTKNHKPSTVLLGIGTNKGNRKKNLNNALDLLSKNKKIKIIQISKMLKNPPQEGIKSGYFLNGAIKIETSLTPLQLLKVCKGVERKLGREKRWGVSPSRQYFSRTIDLDILFYGNKIVKTKNLIIPHPKIEKRYFVLIPLLELEKKLIHPVLKKDLKTIYKSAFKFKRRFK